MSEEESIKRIKPTLAEDITTVQSYFARLEGIFPSLPTSEQEKIISALRGMFEQAAKNYPKVAEIINHSQVKQEVKNG